MEELEGFIKLGCKDGSGGEAVIDFSQSSSAFIIIESKAVGVLVLIRLAGCGGKPCMTCDWVEGGRCQFGGARLDSATGNGWRRRSSSTGRSAPRLGCGTSLGNQCTKPGWAPPSVSAAAESGRPATAAGRFSEMHTASHSITRPKPRKNLAGQAQRPAPTVLS